MKIIKSPVFLIFFSSLFAIIILELTLTLFPSIYPSFGWQNENILENKIKKCKYESKNTFSIFGDSLLEYYGESKINLVNKFKKKAPDKKFCNFSLSGSDINGYIDRFLHVKDQIEIKNAIFFIYEGNDYLDFLYKKDYTKNNITTYNKNYPDRELNFFVNLAKSSYLINILYKNFIKPFFKEDFFEEEKIKIKHAELSKILTEIDNLDLSLIKNKNFSLEKKNLINTRNINVSHYYNSLFLPNYYELINNPNENFFAIQKKIVLFHINFINLNCKKFHINCKIIIIPEANFISKKYQKEFFNFFEFKEKKELLKKPLITKYILNYFDNVFYPENILGYSDYIKLDGHLNRYGNEKLSNFVTSLIN